MALNFNLSDKTHSYGHHFIVGLSGTTLDDTDKRILSELRPSGLLLLGRNFNQKASYQQWRTELKTLITQAAQYAETDKFFVTLDHEGGKVHRTPAPLTHFPDAATYARHAAEVGKAMALELKSIGINLSWAPLADIHSNPQNPIIGKRSFGTTAKEVIEAAVPFLAALSKEGVLGCAKHFPGHGDTSKDSHLELPVVNLPREALYARELLPFKALIDAGVDFIMTAHILYPLIDERNPATISERILKDWLRGELGFKNIVVADDLNMKAVAKAFEEPEVMAKALNAGVDMFLVSRYPESEDKRAISIAQNIVKSLNSGYLSEDTLHTSFDRIKRVYLEKLKPSQFFQLDEAVLEEHRKLVCEINSR